MKRYIKSNRRYVRANAGGTVTLKDMNTDVIPVADFGTYGGMLASELEDVFVYDAVDIDAVDPDSEYYDEFAELMAEKYDGTDEFFKQVLSYAPATIQAAFDDYEIPATVVDGSCKWNRPRFYNYSDDVIEFDMTIDTNWVESKFREFSNEPKFKSFLEDNYSSRSGFISFMPDNTAEYESILDPNDSDYWKLVSAIVTYIVDADPSIRESAMEDLMDDLRGNADYVTFSMFEIF